MRINSRAASVAATLAAFLLPAWAAAQPSKERDEPTYQLPPPRLVTAVDAYVRGNALESAPVVSPDRTRMLVLSRPILRSIAELAEPTVTSQAYLDGGSFSIRRHSFVKTVYTDVQLYALPDGRRIHVSLPPDARIGSAVWSRNGSWLACVVYRNAPGEIWLVKSATGEAHQLTGPILYTAHNPLQWLNDRELLATLIPRGRGSPPPQSAVPAGPQIQQTDGVASAGRAAWVSGRTVTATEYERTLLQYYAFTELGRIGLDGSVTPLGIHGLFLDPSVSPGGGFILVKSSQTLHGDSDGGPFRAAVYDLAGNLKVEIAHRVQSFASEPAFAGRVPPDRRQIQWRADQPATVAWVQALDGGDSAVPAPWRDEIFELAAPFDGAPVSLVKLPTRIGREGVPSNGIAWGHARLAVAGKWRFNPSRPGGPAEELPGNAIAEPAGQSRRLLQLRDGSRTLLLSQGATSVPVSYELRTKRATSLWQADSGHSNERVLALLDSRGTQLLTSRYDVDTDGSSIQVRDLDAHARKTIIAKRPVPLVDERAVKHEEIDVARDDGLPLRASISTPAGWTPAMGALPTLMWIYASEFPQKADYLEYLKGSRWSNRMPTADFREVALLDYAVIHFRIPVVGSSMQAPQDSLVAQLVAGAQSVITELSRRGVVDRKRMAVGGHSYGGMAAVLLLAHTDLFRAGIASNGLYNLTLAPFGAQQETRTLWQVPGTYIENSPFFAADRIKEPLLILRGMNEESGEIHPAQASGLYAAIKHLGGRARLVEFPLEGHNWSSRESVLHILWEVATWLDVHVKNHERPHAASRVPAYPSEKGDPPPALPGRQ